MNGLGLKLELGRLVSELGLGLDLGLGLELVFSF